MDAIVNINELVTNKSIFIKSHTNIDYYLLM